jgi:hypothetical protein
MQLILFEQVIPTSNLLSHTHISGSPFAIQVAAGAATAIWPEAVGWSTVLTAGEIEFVLFSTDFCLT